MRGKYNAKIYATIYSTETVFKFPGFRKLHPGYLLQHKQLNTRHHLRQILALSEIYGNDKVARAIDDALTFNVFRSEYIANIL